MLITIILLKLSGAGAYNYNSLEIEWGRCYNYTSDYLESMCSK